MTNSQKYNVAIIGAGRIGCGFDTPDSPQVLTHAHTIQKNIRTELSAIVDIDEARGKKEAAKWNTTYFRDVDEMIAVTSPDIFVIASPDDTHIPILLKVKSFLPKLIICEKPIQLSKNDGKKIKQLTFDVPVVVNYRRRFDPTVVNLREKLAGGSGDAVISATGYFSGGLLHNGSHLIDLARFLFGEISVSATGMTTFEKCPQFHLVESRSSAYSIFELDILTETGRFRFIDEGFVLQSQEVVDDPVFEGFRMLGDVRSEGTELIHAMENMLKHAVDILDTKAENISSLENALQTEDACFKLLAKA